MGKNTSFLILTILLAACTSTTLEPEDNGENLPETLVVNEEVTYTQFEDEENKFSISLPESWEISETEPTEAEQEGVLKSYEWTAGQEYSGAELYGEPLNAKFTLSIADETNFDLFLLEETPRTSITSKYGNVYYYFYTRDLACEQMDSNPNKMNEDTVRACALLKAFEKEVKVAVDSFELID